MYFIETKPLVRVIKNSPLEVLVMTRIQTRRDRSQSIQVIKQRARVKSQHPKRRSARRIRRQMKSRVTQAQSTAISRKK